MIKKIESQLSRALLFDRYSIRRQLIHIKRSNLSDRKTQVRLIRLQKRLDTSIKKKSWRKANHPKPAYNDTLPITSKKEDIIEAIRNHPVLIISGDTGSGKSTQIPKFCLAAGRGINGIVGCTQPRRIAATTVSRRIAEEMGEEIGRSVGYKIRFSDRTHSASFIKIMTDGILLAETQTDPYLAHYDTLIVDEAHERSLNIDFILGILRRLIRRRKELKLIITSATIDTEKFSRAFDDAPVIEVSGRMYPVEVRYKDEGSQGNDATHIDMAVDTIDSLQNERVRGDILVFMPTEQDIRETCEILESRGFKGVTVLPLFAKLSAAEQLRVFSRPPGRKIIVATNVAETSITIPGIKYVVDTGLARISQYSPRTRTTALPVSAISKSSADQRKGRSGRVENGICIRLYTEEDFETRPVFTPPEILRSNLAEVILRMTALSLGDASLFPFIDKPTAKSIQDGVDLLLELGAIVARRRKDKAVKKNPYALTPRGRMMAKLPIDPRLSRMLIQAQHEGCLKEMMIIASALSVRDPRERPTEKTVEADQMHKTFEDRNSDFISLLNIWNRYHDALQTEKTTAGLRRFCKRNFLSYMRMREWRDIHYQIGSLLEESVTSTNAKKNRSGIENEDEDTVRYRAIHRSVLSGFLSNIAEKKEQNLYKAAQGRDVMIFPGSGIFNRAKQWIVAVEMVETSRLFARCVGNIDASWILDLGRDQCKYSYQHPRWDKSRGEVVASEQVSLYGLIIVPQRPVSYGLISPGEAADIFIRDALVADDLDDSFDFLKHNTALIDEIRDLENRIRRRDLLVGEEKLRRFYKERLAHVYNVTTLRKRIKEKGADDFLRMDKKFLLKNDPDAEEMALFPDRILLGTNQFNCQYRYEPGKSEDGLTVKLPVTVASAIPPDSVDWLVPGLLKEKITAMIKGLPKAYRKKLVPISKVVDIVLKEMPKREAPLASSLSQFVFKRFRIDIPASEWSVEDLPDHLKMRLCLTDTKGKEIRSGRDKALLTRELSRPDDEEEFCSAKQQWEKHNIKRWDFGDLPETIYMEGKTGIRWIYYPALTKSNGSVNLRLFRHRDKALSAHKQGVAALYAVTLSKEFKLLRKMMTLPQGMKQAVSHFGSEHQVESRIFESVVSDLFFKNIRTETAFLRHAESVKPSMFQIGKEKQECTVAVLRQYHQTRMLLLELESANQTNRRATVFLKHLFNDLSKLLPVNFLELYHTERLKYLVRYLKTMAVRAQRGIVDFERDQARAKELKIYTDSLDGFLKGLDHTVSEEKRKDIEDFFWLIEEYKVSLFAQELKTAVPVSKKRLDAKIKAIRRKV